MNPVVPTTACTSCAAHQRRFSRAAATTVKSTLTSAPAVDQRVRRRRDVEVGARDRLARVLRIDRGDELAVAGTEHRRRTPSRPCAHRLRTPRP